MSTHTKTLKQPVKSRQTTCETVICLHASASSGMQWNALKDAISGGFEVICPDLAGYGSEPVEYQPWSHRMEDEVAPLLDLLNQQVAPVHLVGHSMGGTVASQLALRCPEKVASLSLFEPVSMNLLMAEEGYGEEMRELLSVYTQLSLNVADQQPTAAARNYIDFWSGAGTWSKTPSSSQQQIMLRISKAQREFEALVSDTTQAIDYRRLTMPVCYITGDAGPVPPRNIAKIIIQQLPNVRGHHLEGAGHMAPITDPERINPLLIDFIRQHSSSSAETGNRFQSYVAA